MGNDGLGLSFDAFLSHRYKSPEINSFFFGLFSEVADVQFAVDRGTVATNVTRLERSIRDSDAFIGIYPFEGSRSATPTREDLAHASRYFRLELDLAVRSGKPAIVFYDKHLRGQFRVPPTIPLLEFDSAEITSAGGFPTADRYRKAFRGFCEAVAAWKTYEVSRPGYDHPRTAVALVVPTSRGSGYTPKRIELLRSVLGEHGYEETQVCKWPPALDGETVALFGDVDWVIADIGDPSTASLVAFLHGSFVPTMRLAYRPSGESSPLALPLEGVLFRAFEVGYAKDIVRWSDSSSMRTGVLERVVSLNARPERISTTREAEDYFRSAALRKEAVFLSYSGEDQDIARDIRIALEKRFQTVFDYRDAAKSIRPGQAWVDEIFTQLSASALGIPLLSESYVQSGYCMHEARDMVSHRDAGAMTIIPIKLSKGELKLPASLADVQYLRLWEHGDAETAVLAVLRALSNKSE